MHMQYWLIMLSVWWVMLHAWSGFRVGLKPSYWEMQTCWTLHMPTAVHGHIFKKHIPMTTTCWLKYALVPCRHCCDWLTCAAMRVSVVMLAMPTVISMLYATTCGWVLLPVRLATSSQWWMSSLCCMVLESTYACLHLCLNAHLWAGHLCLILTRCLMDWSPILY